MNSWPLLMLLQNFLAALFILQSRKTAKRFERHAIQFNLVVFFIIAFSGIFVALLLGFGSVSVSAFTSHYEFFALAGICFALTNIFSYAVLEYVDAATASLMSTLNIVTAVLASTFLLDEGLSALQVCGAVLLLISFYTILSINVNPGAHKKLVIALLLSVLASIFFGISTATEKFLLNQINIESYMVFGWGVQFLGVVLTAVFFLRKTRDYRVFKSAEFWRLSASAGVLRAFAGGTFIAALLLADNLSLISVLSGLKIIIVTVLGYIVLRERQNFRRKAFAATLAAIGVAMLFI